MTLMDLAINQIKADNLLRGEEAKVRKLRDATNGLLGLLQLISVREDVSDELREVLRTNHRVEEARRVLEETA